MPPLVAANGLQQDPGFAHTSIQERFAPFLRADGRPKKFDVTIGHPGAALEVMRSEVLDCRASRGPLRSCCVRLRAQSRGQEAPVKQGTVGRRGPCRQ